MFFFIDGCIIVIFFVESSLVVLFNNFRVYIKWFSDLRGFRRRLCKY